MICDFCKEPIYAANGLTTWHPGCYHEAASLFESYKGLVAAVLDARSALVAVDLEISSRFAIGERGLNDMSDKLRRVVVRARAAIERIDKLGVK